MLVKARDGGRCLPRTAGGVPPASVADAHAIQDAVTAGIGQAGRRVQSDGAGQWRADPRRDLCRHDPSPRRRAIPAAEVPQCGVEGEVAFIFRRDLPARAAPYSREEVAAAVDACAAIEVGDQPLPELRCGLQSGEAGGQHQQRRLRACRAAGRLARPGTRQAEGDADGERRAGAGAGGRAPDRRSARRRRGAGEHDARQGRRARRPVRDLRFMHRACAICSQAMSAACASRGWARRR